MHLFVRHVSANLASLFPLQPHDLACHGRHSARRAGRSNREDIRLYQRNFDVKTDRRHVVGLRTPRASPLSSEQARAFHRAEAAPPITSEELSTALTTPLEFCYKRSGPRFSHE